MLFLYLTLLLPPNCLPPSPPPPPSLPLPSLPSFLSHTAIRNTLTCPCRESDINDKRGRSFINVINVTNGHEKQLDRDVSDVTMPERHPLLLRAPQKKSYIHIHIYIYICICSECPEAGLRDKALYLPTSHLFIVTKLTCPL